MSTALYIIKSPPVPALWFPHSLQKTPKFEFPIFRNPNISNSTSNCNSSKMLLLHRANAAPSLQVAVSEAMNLVQLSQPTWQSALLSNVVIFVLGSPILVSGLSPSGIAAAFLLGTLTWRAFGPSGFLLVATYFIIVTRTKIFLLCDFTTQS